MHLIADLSRCLRQMPRLVPVAISMLVLLGTVAGVVLAAAGGTPQEPSGLVLPISSRSSGPVPSNAPAAPALGGPRSGPLNVPVARHITSPPLTSRAVQSARVAPLGRLRQADLLIVAPFSLSSKLLTQVSRQPAVSSVEPIEAARVKFNGEFAAVLGVNPSTFRNYAAKPVASSDRLWQGVAEGGVSVSYSMGTLDRLPLGGNVTVSGFTQAQLPVVAFGTVGIPGVDAVVCDTVAASLGIPSGNGMVISASPREVAALAARLKPLVPQGAVVEPLVTWVVTQTGGSASGSAGSSASGSAGSSASGSAGSSASGSAGGTMSALGSPASGGSFMTSTELNAVLQAALSRRGLPYVWGAAGPSAFDCSGLVQWSFAQAGIAMPRVAADQALTGPAIPVSSLGPGDLLFYRTDPTDPGYISHVAIYLGNGWMIQAPRPGMDVEVVRADVGSQFAGAIRVNPRTAAQEATGIAA